mmetsp:Transcript_45776/g.90267  ORF Transcript_45776/g.90267 Transcript_45776/m.90267 type:complete len:654 (-) Transcript_45776:686-2647(-)
MMPSNDEEAPLIGLKEEETQPRSPYRYTVHALIGTLLVAAWSGTVFGVSEAPFLHKFASQFFSDNSADSIQGALRFHDRYTDESGKPYHSGYDFLIKLDAQLIAAQQLTTIDASGFDSGSLEWDIAYPNGTTATYTTDSSSLAINFLEAGSGTVTVSSGSKSVTKALVSRYMRHEIRNLFEDDRKAFFNALSTVYSVSTVAGADTYGAGYKGADYFIEYHTWMAGTKECDHLHDGMGFLTGHNAITMEFEQNLRMVDATVSVPYWDYTIDIHHVYENDEDMSLFYKSPIFNEDWFGPMGNDPAKHYAVTESWVADISVDPLDWQMDPSSARITNAYGLMRSPWNVANDKRLLRSNLTFGYASSYEGGPSCSEFYVSMNVSDVVGFTKYAQANAHGAIHTFVGGVSNSDWKTLFTAWDMDSNYAKALGLQGFGVLKDLWRAGVVSCPDSCSSDTSVKDCACSCDDFDTWKLEDIHNILGYRESDIDHATWTSDTGEYLGTKFMALACGETADYEAPFIGDAMNSGATADPSFWPIHPNVDRLFQWRRMQGFTESDVWPYGAGKSASFYWGAGEATVDLDSSDSAGICWGHQPESVMVWKDLGFVDDFKAAGTYYTVLELWELNDPDMGHLPYAYPDYLWEHCAEEGYPADLLHK